MAAYARGDFPEGRGEGLNIQAQELDRLSTLLRETQSCNWATFQELILEERHPAGLDSDCAGLMQRFSQMPYSAPGGLREGLIQEWADVQKQR